MLKVITLVVLAAALACVSGCGSPDSSDNEKHPGYVEIDCTECGGDGIILSDDNGRHIPPREFTCPMCSGFGKLFIWGE